MVISGMTVTTDTSNVTISLENRHFTYLRRTPMSPKRTSYRITEGIFFSFMFILNGK